MREFFSAVGPLLIPCLSFAGLALALAVTVVILRRRIEGGVQLPPATAAAVGSVCLGAMVGTAWWFGLREVMPTPDRPAELINKFAAEQEQFQELINGSSLLSGGGAGEVPLAPSEIAPSLEAEGWLNGPPPTNQDLTGRLVVVDAFDDFCPKCRDGAPMIIKAYERFRDRVTFISLTTNAETTASAFAAATGVPWPIGYDAVPAIHALGAGAPTVFLIGPDGRVLWNDNRARYRHKLEELEQTLSDAIEQALADQPGVENVAQSRS